MASQCQSSKASCVLQAHQFFSYILLILVQLSANCILSVVQTPCGHYSMDSRERNALYLLRLRPNVQEASFSAKYC